MLPLWLSLTALAFAQVPASVEPTPVICPPSRGTAAVVEGPPLRGAAGGVSEAAPPARNVHLVLKRDGNLFWRGAAPRSDTVEALLRAARARNVQVTLIDLRHPFTRDDLTGAERKLTPAQESKLAEQLGAHYHSLSAMDKKLPSLIDAALKKGDVYIHCMYGVNRTGFAVARFALAEHEQPDRVGLGKKDWDEGAAFQRRVATP